LDKLIAWRGMPNRIRVDNGPEYISHAMGEWAEERGIELKFIQPGSPYQNGYVERFNKSYREEVLDAFSFTRIKEANALSQAWAWIYNNERPHKSLGYQPPITFAQQRRRSGAPKSLLPDQQYQWKALLLSVTN
jgi:putative transposase